MRSLATTIGSAALGVGIGLGVLVAGFWVSNLALAQSTTTVASGSGAAIAATGSSGPTAKTAASAPSTITPSVPTAAPTTTPVPSPTKDPLLVTAYSGQGIRLAALAMPVGYTLTSPMAGTVTVIIYQFIDGEVRSGADLTDRASYPYVLIRSTDREIKLRPGALDKDVQLFVKDGDTVAAGAPVLKILGSGASSWATFYDKAVTAQVMASVTNRPQGTEVDPVPVFKR
jgi:biotin carboxyl carrier protein